MEDGWAKLLFQFELTGWEMTSNGVVRNGAEAKAKEVLELSQFVVTKIPETERPTPDFIVQKNGEQVLLEVTEKEPMEAFAQMLHQAKEEGSATLTREISSSNRLDGVIRAKAKQLESPVALNGFKVLWIAGTHADSEFMTEAIFRTLYGTVRVSAVPSLDMEEMAKVGIAVRYCFYYNRFTFYRARELDGVIFYGHGRGYVFVNPLGVRLKEFRVSEICSMFARAEGMRVVDPEVQHGELDMFLGLDVDRSDGRAKWQYLREKYGVLTSPLVENQFLGLMPVEIPD
ncbi:hypothetical protein [Corallococcus silvisoli]|uniref:hypothetical protein n=1 Tax=Corallococcus silvisoli TaxID=2697031 RepID=UPI0013774D66|nr:hypothetical protein [Corallococcus silvisoli]NBD13819.1 hypothetical protein [Corallococcus silvisoli]